MYDNNTNAYKMYQTINVNTASPQKLLLMLYDGAIKFCRFAEAALDEGDYEKKNIYIKKTQNIINELMVTLNYDAGDIAKNLYLLYDFMMNELIQANIKKDKSKIVLVRGMLEDLRNTWAAVIN